MAQHASGKTAATAIPPGRSGSAGAPGKMARFLPLTKWDMCVQYTSAISDLRLPARTFFRSRERGDGSNFGKSRTC